MDVCPVRASIFAIAGPCLFDEPPCQHSTPSVLQLQPRLHTGHRIQRRTPSQILRPAKRVAAESVEVSRTRYLVSGGGKRPLSRGAGRGNRYGRSQTIPASGCVATGAAVGFASGAFRGL